MSAVHADMHFLLTFLTTAIKSRTL